MVEGKDVFCGVTIEETMGQIPEQITGLCCDSRSVNPGDLFIALRGQNFDGHDFLQDIARDGACAAVVDQCGSPRSLAQIRVKDTLASLPRIAANYYSHPAKELKLIGITGSNGKTTSAYLMESILKTAGITPGILGTIEYRFQNLTIPAETTTPLPHTLHKMFRDFVDAGCEYLVMEVSSHGLSLNRVDEVEFDIGLYTNLSQDHLDFHQTMDAYRDAKKKLFLHHLKPNGVAVLNTDDETGLLFSNQLRNLNQITYAIDTAADLRATNIEMSAQGSRFNCVTDFGNFEFQTSLVGKHNIYNILGTMACALVYGIKPETIQRGIRHFKAVPGRLERIENTIGATILVDYCHTPDALEKSLQTLKALPHQRIITVFGCGGDRDKTKRPLMGNIAAKYSHEVFITNDNPRTEDPTSILNDIERGITTNTPYTIIEDRHEAIGTAIKNLNSGDVLLIAGKGHEDYQIIGREKIHFDDREVAREWLQQLNMEDTEE